MTFLAIITLAVVMLALAALPSASVALVITRSASLGVGNGAAVAFGIVLGDLVFVALAMLGMNVLAETMGAFFAIIRYIGGFYLIWLGAGLLLTKGKIVLKREDSAGPRLLTSFLAGLFLTLGDAKAILFYASLFPIFVDMNQLTGTAIFWIFSVTILTVGGVKMFYAFAASRIVSRFQNRRAQKYSRIASGTIMVGTGVYLIAKV
ncbi:LysE family translocator [Luteolibacter algae]|uniref:LysE family translocator n=1 Tax=Luteolibacter algae TaxID=454151 RepID=A0ABW5DB50_9BACT